MSGPFDNPFGTLRSLVEKAGDVLDSDNPFVAAAAGVNPYNVTKQAYQRIAGTGGEAEPPKSLMSREDLQALLTGELDRRPRSYDSIKQFTQQAESDIMRQAQRRQSEIGRDASRRGLITSGQVGAQQQEVFNRSQDAINLMRQNAAMKQVDLQDMRRQAAMAALAGDYQSAQQISANMRSQQAAGQGQLQGTMMSLIMAYLMKNPKALAALTAIGQNPAST
jgi:hypothetical protein